MMAQNTAVGSRAASGEIPAFGRVSRVIESISARLFEGWFGGKNAGICLAVVALQQPRRLQRRNGSRGSLGLREAIASLNAAQLVAARRVLEFGHLLVIPKPRWSRHDVVTRLPRTRWH